MRRTTTRALWTPLLWTLPLAAALTGCPAPAPPANPPPGTPAPSPTNAAPSPDSTPASTPAPESEPGATPRARPSTGARSERLALGTQLRPWEGVTLGLKQVEELPVLEGGARQLRGAAVLSLGIGQVYALLDLVEGQRCAIGGAELELTKVGEGWIDFRWTRLPEGLEAPRVTRAPSARLREVGLYELPDGRVVGVGKVTPLAKQDGATVPVVSLTLFPKGYRQDPLQDYGLFPRVVAEKPVGEGALRLRLRELLAATPSAPGSIVLQLPK